MGGLSPSVMTLRLLPNSLSGGNVNSADAVRTFLGGGSAGSKRRNCAGSVRTCGSRQAWHFCRSRGCRGIQNLHPHPCPSIEGEGEEIFSPVDGEGVKGEPAQRGCRLPKLSLITDICAVILLFLFRRLHLCHTRTCLKVDIGGNTTRFAGFAARTAKSYLSVNYRCGQRSLTALFQF